MLTPTKKNLLELKDLPPKFFAFHQALSPWGYGLLPFSWARFPERQYRSEPAHSRFQLVLTLSPKDSLLVQAVPEQSYVVFSSGLVGTLTRTIYSSTAGFLAGAAQDDADELLPFLTGALAARSSQKSLLQVQLDALLLRDTLNELGRSLTAPSGRYGALLSSFTACPHVSNNSPNAFDLAPFTV